MKFLPLAATLITIIVLLSKNYSRSKKNKRMEELRRKWGFPKIEYFNFDKIELYSKLKYKTFFHTLNSQTKSDIDLNDVFAFIDRTSSKVGQQYLYDKICKPTNQISALTEMNQQIDFFTSNQKEREDAQMLLSDLNDDNAYHIASLLSGELPEKPSWFNWVIADVATIIILLLLSFRFPFLLAWLMVPLAVNMALHYWNKNNTFYFAASLPQLNMLVNVCKTLSKQGLPFNNDIAKKSSDDLKKFQQTMRLLGFRQSSLGGDLDVVVHFIINLLKAFFLVELIAFFNLIKELKNKQESIRNLFNYAGAVDAAISIASLRASETKTCVPVFHRAGKTLKAKKVYHPLIENCVVNDIEVKEKSVLITGSNMSGKTSFLRTVAVNGVLAQSIYTCFAESYCSPMMRLFSSIRIDDSLQEGKSYYFEEVNIMALLVNEVLSGNQNIFILDEVFKGTNTIERIASAKAILSYLNKNNNIVFVSTHDIELSDMLKEEYDLHHFEENIINGELQFDHKLKPGQLKTRNAIKILQIAGYPAQIIDEATAISTILSTDGAA